MREVQETSDPLDVCASAAWPSACWGNPSRKPVSAAGVAYPTPQCALRGEANADGIASGASNRRVQGLRTGPDHVAPITGYGAKAPAGFPCWMSMGNSRAAISGRNGRSGAREDAHRQRKLAPDYPRR